MAEREGFEPSVEVSPHTRLAGERLQPARPSLLDSDESERPLQNGTLCPISASDSNFNPRNTTCIPVVEIFAFLELEHKLPFFKGPSEYY